MADFIFFLKHSFTTEQLILMVATAVSAMLLIPSKPIFFRFFMSIFKMIGRFFRLKLRLSKKNEITIEKVNISDDARLRHTHIVGSTGTGKTVLLETLISQDILRGYGAFIIDPKGDRNLFERVKAICEMAGRSADLKLLSANFINESYRWNPCRLGNPSELQTKWFQSGVYHEPFYAKACEFALIEAFSALVHEYPKGFTLSHLVNKIKHLSQEKAHQDHLKGLFYELKNFEKSEWGKVICSEQDGGQTKGEISLLDIIRKNEILFVDLPTEAKGVQSSRLGKLLLQEIMLISGLRKIYPALCSSKPFSIYIDEFDAFATEGFSTFLNKGRSSHFMIHIAHQTLSDLKKVNEFFMGQILGNCAVKFIFRQDDPVDAELWSRFLGTKSSVAKTYKTSEGMMTGDASNREVYEFKVSPDEIKSLKTGECVFSEKFTHTQQKLQISYPVLIHKRNGMPDFSRIQRQETDLTGLKQETNSLTNNKDGWYEKLFNEEANIQ